MIVIGQGKTSIPVRSLWLLLVYASDMLAQLRTEEREAILAGHRDNDLVDAIAEVLVDEVERRLRQQLSFHYRRGFADLTRVRGRIDHLRTESRRLMDQGRIACAFDELSIDSPRNRFVAQTLSSAARIVISPALKHRCNGAAFRMQRLGVTARPPTRSELSIDRLSRHDAADRRMLDSAYLVHDMAIPTHQVGTRMFPKLRDDDQQYRRLFERAVRGFFRHAPAADDWTVSHPHLYWHDEDDMDTTLLPRMETDTVLTSIQKHRRIVIETKFADALTENHFQSSATTIKRDYLFQIYAYLMSQTGSGDDLKDRSEGVLLFVAANGRDAIDQTVRIQGHSIRFLSVDMTEAPHEIRQRWLRCIAAPTPKGSQD